MAPTAIPVVTPVKTDVKRIDGARGAHGEGAARRQTEQLRMA